MGYCGSVRRWLVVPIICLVLLFVAEAQANDVVLPLTSEQAITVCQFEQFRDELPDFNEPECKSLQFRDVDPQHQSLWLLITFDQQPSWQYLQPPYGLYLFGKAASSVYFNGQLLGSNGMPGTPDSEVAGQMDTVFYLPEPLVRDRANQLVIHLSGHHSVLPLNAPMHFIGIGQFGDAKRFLQRLSKWGLVLVGAFVVGALFFCMLSFGPNGQPSHRLFAVLCLLAAIQLSTEVARGLISYSYPWHDIRLLVVTGCSVIFGMLLLLYSSLKVASGQAIHWIYGGLLCTLAVVLYAPGFDAKTTAGVFVPLLISSLQLLLYWRVSKHRATLRWFLVQLAIVITIVVNTPGFHEIIHFSIIAVLLCYLFIQQANEHRAQLQQLQHDQARIAKLEYKLSESAQSNSPAKLEISVAGRTEYIDTTSIAYCKAAGDYVELYLTNLDERLYSGSLKQLEEMLPSTFLRVHRSYLVNLHEVVALDSKPSKERSGVLLRLAQEQRVPVSRRLLPAVRDSLKQTLV
ncbi:hypothetical protein GCM10011369_23990 [Neiella marina]|uniref:HTH LytTR-type domain-containing protein n=1 Tax=Neiella marina TaxID=508461 RepID=A0A8J2XMV0_9GAMM|nr:hypothetical protein GCM10011369_23990 [Neiella marina]